jgi:hypothetical protein
MQPLYPQPGSTIDPRNAVGRRATIARASRDLRAGNNLGLNDPRRMGKTVLLDVFCATPPDGLLAVKIDYEGVGSTEEFLTRTVEKLRSHAGTGRRAVAALGSLFDNLEVGAGPVAIKVGVASKGPTALLIETVHAVARHLDGKTLVIAMDEVPIAIGNIATKQSPEDAHQLLQALRSLRKESNAVRWIVCGSIGFHHVLKTCGATTGVINDLTNLPLGPLDDGDAEELAHRLLLGIERVPNAADGQRTLGALVSVTGGVPFLIHSLAHWLQDHGSGPLVEADVAAAYQGWLDDKDGSRAVTHLVTRVDELYRDRADAAKAVLDLVAASGPTPVVELDAGGVLDDLVDDHYLILRGATVEWRYDVFRRMWTHRRSTR